MFNVNDVTAEMENEAASMGLMEPGWYNIITVGCEKKSNKAGTGEYIELVMQPEGSKRKLWYYFNTGHSDQRIVSMGLVQLKKFCLAVNKNGFNETHELCDLMLAAKVEIKKDKDGKPRETITDFAPYIQQTIPF